MSVNLSTGEATGVHLTGVIGQGVLYFHWIAFPFHLVQSAITEFLLMKTHRVSTDGESRYYCKKAGVFIVFEIRHTIF